MAGRFDDDFWDSVEYDPNFGWEEAQNLLFDEYNHFAPGTDEFIFAVNLWEDGEYDLWVAWQDIDPSDFWDDFRDAYDLTH